MPIENEANTTETEPVFCSKEQQAAAQLQLQSYLKENKSSANSIQWHLHVFCRVGEGEDYHYDDNEIYSAGSFIEKLIKFFLTGDNAKRFDDLSPESAFTLSDYLPRLQELFTNLSEDYCMAQLEEIEVVRFGSTMTVSEAESYAYHYQRKRKIAAALVEAYPGRQRNFNMA